MASDQSPPEKLLGTPCRPEHDVSHDELRKLVSGYLVVHENFLSLCDFLDSSLKDGYVIVTGETPETAPITPREYERTRLYRHLHNYLASVYSFNEQTRLLVNAKRGDPEETDTPLGRGAFVPEKATLYTRKLAFVRGLRADFQHGDFSSVRLERVADPDPSLTEDGSEVYRVVFDREAFRNGATKAPNKYLQEVSVETARYVTSYLDSFHRDHFADFATDTEAWFRLAYES